MRRCPPTTHTPRRPKWHTLTLLASGELLPWLLDGVRVYQGSDQGLTSPFLDSEPAEM